MRMRCEDEQAVLQAIRESFQFTATTLFRFVLSAQGDFSGAAARGRTSELDPGSTSHLQIFPSVSSPFAISLRCWLGP